MPFFKKFGDADTEVFEVSEQHAEQVLRKSRHYEEVEEASDAEQNSKPSEANEDVHESGRQEVRKTTRNKVSSSKSS